MSILLLTESTDGRTKMPLGGLLMAVLVYSVAFPLLVIMVIWPRTIASLNAAALRSFPLVGPRALREQVAEGSTAGTVRLVAILGFGILIVNITSFTQHLLEDGIVPSDGPQDQGMVWAFCAFGAAQAVFGGNVLFRARRIFERLGPRFAQDGAELRRWMIVFVGALGLAMAGVAFFIAFSFD